MPRTDFYDEGTYCGGCGLPEDLCDCVDPTWDDREDEIESGGVGADPNDPYSEEWQP